MEKEIKNSKCAQCKKIFDRANTPKELWPFCSKRCKMIDLGQWLSEKYVVNDGEPINTEKNHDDEDNNE